MHHKPPWLFTRGTVLVLVLAACCCHDSVVVVAAEPGGAAVTAALGVSKAWPSTVNQYVETTVRVTLNASACRQQGQKALQGAQLVFQQVTAKGGSLAFRSSAPGKSVSTADCTTFDFPVLLDGSSRHGNISARLLLPKAGISLQLQDPIVVSVPLLLSVITPVVNVTADPAPFGAQVRLNQPAPAGGVSVRLLLGQEGAAKVEPDVLFWPEGESGSRNFTLALLSAPDGGVLNARLSSPTGGAVLQPGAATVRVRVQSPVLSTSTNLGFYRGMNGSRAPRLDFTMNGSSAFPVEFAFTTFLLPGSRPALLPCHPLAPSCSVADQEAVDNVTISGSRYITPGQRGIPPVDVPISWARLPQEAELRVGVRIMCLRNCRAADQTGQVAAIIFGTPPGHCPPGAVLAEAAEDMTEDSSKAGSSSSDRPTYTHVAALQELALVVDTQSSSSHVLNAANNADRRLLSAPGGNKRTNLTSSSSSSRSTNTTSGPSKNTSSSNSSSSKARVKGVVVVPHVATAGTRPVAPDANSTDSSSTLDLDPPFRPLVDRYIALLPPGPTTGQLMLSSSRWGDVVVVDTTACGELDSARYTVSWRRGQQLWREYFPLAGQKAPCWIRVHVFTRLADGAASAASQDSGSQPERGSRDEKGLKDPAPPAGVTADGASSMRRRPLQAQTGAVGSSNSSSNKSSSSTGPTFTWNSSSDSGNSTASSSPSVWDLPANFVLYRSYTIRFVPLRPPEQLSLRAITFSNNATTVIACGVPAAWEHLFVVNGPAATAQTPPPPSGAAGAMRPSSIMSSSYAAASSRAVDANGSISRENTTAPAPNDAAAGGGSPPSAFRPLSENSETGGGPRGPASGSRGSSPGGHLPPLTAAPGVDVQVAYLVMRPPGSNSSSSSAAQDVAAAAKLPKRLRLQQFSVLDRASHHTVIWSRFTAAECAQDRYILLPMAQIKPDMRMVPELVDPDGFDAGVKIAMSAAAVALPGGMQGNGSSSSIGGSNGGGSGSGGTSGSSTPLGVPSDGSTSVSSWLLGQKFQEGGFASSPAAAQAAAAAVDGGKGYGGAGRNNFGDEVWCNGANGSLARGMRGAGSDGLSSSTSSGGGGNDGGCRLQLPGLTAELPIILTADEGRSSKTYTMLLYSNATAATAVHDLILPQEAAAGRGGQGGGSGSGSSASQAADAAALSAAYFSSRPGDWPQSPAQGTQCSICPNGTYSTKTDSVECKVCPPGKYAASPFSTTCLYCPPGSFSYYWGAPTCRTCLPGTFAASAGSLFCDICREGTTTRFEGATQCEVTVAGGSQRLDDTLGAADVAILLSFGLLLDGTSLESVSRSLTGINGSSEGIVGVLVRGDTASALNISLGSVQVLAVQQIGSRQLLVNVSAALPVTTDQAAAAAAAQQDLSADPLIQRLIDDPNTFLRTTQTLGAESASVQDFTTQMTQRAKWRHHLQLHAILWPTLVGVLLLMALGSWGWRRRKRRQLQMAQMASGRTEPAAAVAVSGLAGLFGTSLQQRSARAGSAAAAAGQASGQEHGAGWGRRGSAAAAAAAPGPGWFYGDGFMGGGGGGVGVGVASLHRSSLNSSDAGDSTGMRGRQGIAGTLHQLHRLLSSRIRIVFKVPSSSRDPDRGASSPTISSTPSPSSCGASDASDSMERGVEDVFRVKVLVGSSSPVDGSPAGGHACSTSSNPHAHDLCLREESFVARLRSSKQQQLP